MSMVKAIYFFVVTFGHFGKKSFVKRIFVCKFPGGKVKKSPKKEN